MAKSKPATPKPHPFVRIRNRHSMTQAELSRVVELAQGTISKVEAGRCQLTIRTARKVAARVAEKGYGKYRLTEYLQV